MGKNIDEILAGLEPARRRVIEERASRLMAEELSLRELRKARELTQAQLATTLGITQDGVSRLEKRSDLLVSTLRKTIKAMGGDLKLVASFPDQAPVELSGIPDSKL